MALTSRSWIRINASPTARVRRDLEQVVRTEAAEGHARKLEADRRRVGGRDERTFEPSLEPTAREGKEHVQEQDGRDQVERLTDREGRSLLAQESVAAKLAKPAAISSGPKRLSGRRDQAKSPQST